MELPPGPGSLCSTPGHLRSQGWSSCLAKATAFASRGPRRPLGSRGVVSRRDVGPGVFLVYFVFPNGRRHTVPLFMGLFSQVWGHRTLTLQSRIWLWGQQLLPGSLASKSSHIGWLMASAWQCGYPHSTQTGPTTLCPVTTCSSAGHSLQLSLCSQGDQGSDGAISHLRHLISTGPTHCA